MGPARSLLILRIVGLFGIASFMAASPRAEEGSCHNPRTIGSAIRVSTDDQRSTRPQVIPAGEEIGIFWHSGPDAAGSTRLARFTHRGALVAAAVPLAGVQEGPVVWDGAAWATAYATPLASFGVMGVEFARRERDGDPLGTPLLVPALFAQASSLVWTGTEFGLAFDALNQDAHLDVWLARVDSGGEDLLALLGPTGNDHIRPQVQWDGTSYGITWDARGPDPYRFSFALMDPDAGVTSIRHDGFDDDSFVRQLLWTGSQYAQLFDVVNETHTGFDSFVAFFHGTEIPGNVAPLPSADSHRLAWSGGGFGLAGSRADEGVWFQALDASGAADGDPVELSPTGVGEASVARVGDGYTAAWEDTRDGRSEIYMARIGCNCSPADVPGNEVDEDCSGAPLCSPSAPWKGPGAFLACVSRECARLTAEGLLTQAVCSQAVRQAAHSRSSRMSLFRERRHR